LSSESSSQPSDLHVSLSASAMDYPIVTENGDNRIATRRAIMKPFRPNELLSVVREVLDGRTQPSAARG
jgi:hypothetical protein